MAVVCGNWLTELAEDTSPQLGGDLDPNGHLIGGASADELGRLSGVTSPIQTQLDAKAADSHDHDATYQPIDADLTALAGLSSTGGWAKRTGANTWEISTPTASDVGADAEGTAASEVGTHESAYNHTNYDAAYGWGDHAGLYDPAGAAATEITAHESDYSHDSIATNSAARHTQNTDTKLDEGGANEVTAAQAKAANTHVSSDGSDHSDVVINSAHVAGDGSDHADVASNTTHRGTTTGNPHSVSASDVGLGNVVNIAQIFEDSSGVIRQRSGYDDDFVFGSPQLDDDDDSDHDKRMFFDKSKGYFFAGSQTGTNADDANRGSYSANFGYGGTAEGYASTHFGANGTASGDYSTHFGYSGTASGYYSTHFGYSGTASGYYSTHFGYFGTASGYCSTHFGSSGIADKWGQFTHGGGYFTWGENGAAQTSSFVLRAKTEDATAEQMYLNDSSSNKLTIPTDTAWAFDIHVIAAEQGMANIKEFERKGVIVNDGGSTSIGTVDTIGTDRTIGSPGAWDVTVQADDTNDTLDINITGEAATNIRWVANVRVAEVSYPAA